MDKGCVVEKMEGGFGERRVKSETVKKRKRQDQQVVEEDMFQVCRM